MAPLRNQEPLITSEKNSPTKENKPPIPSGAGAKKSMEAHFAGSNHMEFRQRSSSASRTTVRSFSRGSTPSRDTPDGAVDPELLKSALKKIPSLEKISLRPTPPRSRSISRSNSPLPDEELADESLPDFYKLTLKPTERTGSQTRDILLAGNRKSRDVTPSRQRDSTVPEFRRVTLRRTPSREQVDDEESLRASTRRRSTVVEGSTTNLSRSGSFTSLTAINKAVLSRRNSTSSTSEDQKLEFKGVVLKKTGSRPGSRSGSPTKKAVVVEAESLALKKVETTYSRSASRRGSATSETEFSNVSLKKSKKVTSDQSKFQVDQVSLKPIPYGEESSSSAAGLTTIETAAVATSSSRQRVLRETKFEGGDDEYSNIHSSLAKLKQRNPTEEEVMAKSAEAKMQLEGKTSSVNDDAAAKPILFRKHKKLSREEEEEEKIKLKPVDVKKMPTEEGADKMVSKPVNLEHDEDKKVKTDSHKKSGAEEKDTKKGLKPVGQQNLSPEQEDEKIASKSVNLEHDKKVKPDGRKKSEEKDSQEALKSASRKKLSPEREDEKIASKPVSLRKSAAGDREAQKPLKPASHKKLSPEQEDDEKAARPISLKKRMSFSSSIECIKQAVEDEEEQRPISTNLRSISFASSMENIAVGDDSQRENVHLSCFSKEMGSNVDLVQICQDQGPGKHEVKLEFEIEGTNAEKERSDREKKDKEREEQERKEQERIKLEKKERKERRDSERREKEKQEEERLEEERKEMERKEKERKQKEKEEEDRIEEERKAMRKERERKERELEEQDEREEQERKEKAIRLREETEKLRQEIERRERDRTEGEERIHEIKTESGKWVKLDEAEQKEGELNKLRKAPSVDGLFQTQDVHAAFTFTLPYQTEDSNPKLSLEIPNFA